MAVRQVQRVRHPRVASQEACIPIISLLPQFVLMPVSQLYSFVLGCITSRASARLHITYLRG